MRAIWAQVLAKRLLIGIAIVAVSLAAGALIIGHIQDELVADIADIGGDSVMDAIRDANVASDIKDTLEGAIGELGP